MLSLHQMLWLSTSLSMRSLFISFGTIDRAELFQDKVQNSELTPRNKSSQLDFSKY